MEGFTHDGEFVLVAEDGANDLKNYPVKCVNGRIWVNNHAHVLQGKAGISDNSFLAFAISQSDIESLLVGGSRAKLNAETLMSIEFKLPCLQEQYRIGEYLTQLDHLITLHQRKCALLFSPFQALISMMFTTSTFSWEQRKLGDVVQITMGQSPDGSTYSDEPSDYILVQGNADLQNGWVCPRIWTTQITKKADAGDLIMSVRAPAGAMGKTAYNAVIGRGVAAIKGNEFIYQLLVKMDADGFWKTLSCGSTFESLNSDNIKNVEVKIPTTAEQIKIGGYFQLLDNLITLHQRKCISFTGRAGRLISTVNKKRITSSWEQRKLSELTSMHARIGWQNLRTSEFLDSGNYMLITGTDFNDGAINFSTCHYVERERYEQDRNIQIHNGSILITKDGTLGKVAYVQGLSMPATLNAGVFNVQIKDANNVDEKYLFQYLKAPFLMDYVDKKATGGTIKHLNQSILVDFPVILPQRSEQTLIGAFFQQLDNLITLHQRKPFLMKWRTSDANRNKTNRLVL